MGYCDSIPHRLWSFILFIYLCLSRCFYCQLRAQVALSSGEGISRGLWRSRGVRVIPTTERSTPHISEHTALSSLKSAHGNIFCRAALSVLSLIVTWDIKAMTVRDVCTLCTSLQKVSIYKLCNLQT